jgi:hypothetical protein
MRFSFPVTLTVYNRLLPYFFRQVDLTFRYGEGSSKQTSRSIADGDLKALLRQFQADQMRVGRSMSDEIPIIGGSDRSGSNPYLLPKADC